MSDNPPTFDGATPFEFWNTRYDREEYIFGTQPNHYLEIQADRLGPGQSVLAVADGEGRNGVFLAERGLDVHSVDFSPHALAKARKLAEHRGVIIRTEEVDIYNHVFAESAYDAVVAIFIQFIPPERRHEVFDKLKASLKPGGLMILQGYRPEQVDLGTGGPPHRAHMYTETYLADEFADMEILDLEAYDREVDEGPGHRGMSALIGMVARKQN